MGYTPPPAHYNLIQRIGWRIINPPNRVHEKQIAFLADPDPVWLKPSVSGMPKNIRRWEPLVMGSILGLICLKHFRDILKHAKGEKITW